MGQHDVLAYLKKHRNRWFLARELMENFNVARGSIVRTLKVLEETNYIKSQLANKVIRDKSRLKKTTKLALAYSIKNGSNSNN